MCEWRYSRNHQSCIFHVFVDGTNLFDLFGNVILFLVYYFDRGSSSGFHLAFSIIIVLIPWAREVSNVGILPVAEAVNSYYVVWT